MAFMNQSFDNSGSMRRTRFSPSLSAHMAQAFLKMSGFADNPGTGSPINPPVNTPQFTWTDGDETNYRKLNRERKKYVRVQQYVNALRKRGGGSRRASRKALKSVSRCYG